MGFEILPVAKLQLLCYSRGGVIGADMRCELFVAPLLVVTLHLIERIPSGRTRRVELPCAFRTSPAVKILPFDPYQFAALRLHGASPELVWLCFYDRRLALVFQAHWGDEGCFFSALTRDSAQAIALQRNIKMEVNKQGRNANDRTKCCLLDIQQ